MLELAIPVYNEERRLGAGVVKLASYIESEKLPIKLCIADNGSIDRTPDIAMELVNKYPGVRYLRVDLKGVGRALQLAWKSSGEEYVGYVDVDLSTDIRTLPAVVQQLKSGARVVSGTRLHFKSKVKNRTLLREVVSRIFNTILKMALQVKFSDGMCGFKMIHRETYLALERKYFPMSMGWFFNCELLIKSEWHGLVVFDIPVTWVDDRDSKVRLWSLTKEYLREISRLVGERNGKK